MALEIELKVVEARQKDVGRGIVRIDSEAMKDLGITSGDFVELAGKKITPAIVLQAHAEDEKLGIIRMDGHLRQNAGVALGEKIKVRKANIKEAKKFVLAPMQSMKFSPGFENFVKRRLVGRAFNKGDNLYVGLFGNMFPFVVANTQPLGVVMITENTKVLLKQEPMKEKAGIESISYEDIGGLKEEVKKIREMVELPMRHPELFERLGIEAPKGVLIYGAPGTGKTLLAKAVASECDANFISIAGPELVSKFVGESEERMRQVFAEAEENAPTIIFMDEIDAIAPKREEVTGEVERRIVSQLLALMDGLKGRGQVIVIGATNRINAIDPALRRPGRFDREIEIRVPDRNARKEILQIHTRNTPIWHYELSLAVNKLVNFLENLDEKLFEYANKKIDVKKEKIKILQKENSELEKNIEEIQNQIRRTVDQTLKHQLSEFISRKKRNTDIIEELNEKIKQNEIVMAQLIPAINEYKQIKNEKNNFAFTIKSDLFNEKFNIEEIEKSLSKNNDLTKYFIDRFNTLSNEKLKSLIQKIFNAKLDEECIISKTILNKIINEIIEESRNFLIDELANLTHGYTGADISLLVKEAAMKALRRILQVMEEKKIDLEQELIPTEILETIRITRDDFFQAKREILPSALREVFVEIPNVKWDDVGGLDNVKMQLREAIELPLKKPEKFKKVGVRPIRGILLVGLPGTGKTLLAKAVANESEANFISIKGPEIFSKWVGESEKTIRELFRKARSAAPCIIFIDEIDAVAYTRGTDTGSKVGEHVANTLLTEMDGLENMDNVVVLAATNNPDAIDRALLRPGRFDRIIDIPIPDEKARLQIFKIHTKGMPLAKEVDLVALAKATEAYSGADIEGICREAGMHTIRDDREVVTKEDFDKSLKLIKATITAQEQERMGRFKKGAESMFV